MFTVVFFACPSVKAIVLLVVAIAVSVSTSAAVGSLLIKGLCTLTPIIALLLKVNRGAPVTASIGPIPSLPVVPLRADTSPGLYAGNSNICALKGVLVMVATAIRKRLA